MDERCGANERANEWPISRRAVFGHFRTTVTRSIGEIDLVMNPRSKYILEENERRRASTSFRGLLSIYVEDGPCREGTREKNTLVASRQYAVHTMHGGMKMTKMRHEVRSYVREGVSGGVNEKNERANEQASVGERSE